MKARFVLVTAFSLCQLVASAQETGMENGNDRRSPVEVSYASAGKNVNCTKYEYPAQKLVCDGNDFEAKAVARYYYSPGEGRYAYLALQVFLKPLNTKGLKNADYISGQGNYGTFVYHECFEPDGSRKKLCGSADAYARLFSPYVCTVDDELKLEYSAVCDAEHPENNRIKYKLSKSPWSEADKSVYYSSSPQWHYCARWRETLLQDMNPFCFGNGNFDIWDNAHLDMCMHCFNEEKDVAAQGSNYGKSNPGRVRMYFDFSVNGMKGKACMSKPAMTYSYNYSNETGEERYAVGKKENGEVTIEESTLIGLGENQRFFSPKAGGLFRYNFRAHAKCRYSDGTRTDGRKKLFIEQASFSHMFQN